MGRPPILTLLSSHKWATPFSHLEHDYVTFPCHIHLRFLKFPGDSTRSLDDSFSWKSFIYVWFYQICKTTSGFLKSCQISLSGLKFKKVSESFCFWYSSDFLEWDINIKGIRTIKVRPTQWVANHPAGVYCCWHLVLYSFSYFNPLPPSKIVYPSFYQNLST